MVSLFGRGFESHQLHPNKSKSPVVRLNYRTFAFYYMMYQYILAHAINQGGLSISLCKSEKKELYIRYSP